MNVNRGKQFEQVIRDAFNKVENCCIIRLQDNMSGFKGANTICDFIIYKKPYQYFIECKSVHGNTFPFSNITDNQWNGLLKMSSIDGVFAGVICWWVDKDVTRFIPIKTACEFKSLGYKSIRYDSGIPDYLNYVDSDYLIIDIKGQKKRVFFEYDMKDFFDKTFDI